MTESHQLKSTSDLLVEGVEEGNGLDGLAQAHLVSQDGVGVLLPGEAQPVESLQLVRVQSAPRLSNAVWLLLVLSDRLREENTSNTHSM